MNLQVSALRQCLHIPVCWRSNAASICRHLSSSSVHEPKAHSGMDADFESVQCAYQKQLTAGTLQPDSCQAAAVRILQTLQNAVLQREAAAVRQQGSGGGGGGSINTFTTTSATTSTTTSTPPPAQPPPRVVRGAYLWGPVGSGKTALMDLFFQTTQQGLLRNIPLSDKSNTSSCMHPVTTTTPTTSTTPTIVTTPTARTTLTTPTTNPITVTLTDVGQGPMGRCAVRTHFHEFMQSVHGRLHVLQQSRPREVSRSRQGLLVYRYEQPDEDPLVTVARAWGSRTAVLCLDELHVTDVADAMIVARLFGCLLLHHGTTVIFTSNRSPTDLYKGGLSRKYFEPFVQLVNEQMVVVRIAADVDYRRTLAAGKTMTSGTTSTTAMDMGTAPQKEPLVTFAVSGGDGIGGKWYVGTSGANEQLLCDWRRIVEAMRMVPAGANELAKDSSMMGKAVEVPLAYGRRLKVPYTAGNAAYLARAAFFTFDQLCGAQGLRTGMDDGGALVAPDYLALCRTFKELYVTSIPQLGPAQRDEARRLVTLLDVAYDNRCRLHASSEVSPDALFGPLLEEARRQGINPRLGLPKSGRTPGTATTTTTTNTAAASTVSSAPNVQPPPTAPFVPAASVTALLHMQLGPSLTYGSAATNTILPSEFAGTSPTPASAPQSPASFPTSPSLTSLTSSRTAPGDLTVPRAVLAEEVLMYHRATSRLSEMCSVEREESTE